MLLIWIIPFQELCRWGPVQLCVIPRQSHNWDCQDNRTHHRGWARGRVTSIYDHQSHSQVSSISCPDFDQKILTKSLHLYTKRSPGPKLWWRWGGSKRPNRNGRMGNIPQQHRACKARHGSWCHFWYPQVRENIHFIISCLVWLT